jgi:hypothetical protein
LPKLFNGVVGYWLGFTVAITFLQCLADANGSSLYLSRSRSVRPLPRGFAGHVAHPVRSIPIHGNQPLKKGLLRSLMKISGLQEDDL